MDIIVKRQRGGKFIGEGVYGCVFDPPLKCAVKRKDPLKGRHVGKLTKRSDAETEFNMSQYLQKAPYADQYFTPINEMCTPKPRINQPVADMKHCIEPLQRTPYNQMSQIIMPFAGKPLRLVPHTVASIDYFAMGQHLLEAGALLLSRGVVHGDLHTNNIMADSRKSCRFIDFGLAWRPDSLTLFNVEDLARSFNPRINQEPPELSVIYGMQEGLDMSVILERISSQKLTIELLYKVFGLSKQKQMNTLRDFVEQSWSFQNENWYSYYKLYWSKIDAWALGSALLVLAIDMLMDPNFEKDPQFETKGQNTLNIIKGLCEVDPGYRLDAAEALEQWAPDSKILALPEVKAWLEKQHKIRAALKAL